MEFGFGPGKDMMNAYNANRKQLRQKKSMNPQSNPLPNRELSYKQFTPEELEIFKQKIIRNKKKELLQNSILMGVIFVLVLSIMLYILL